MRNKLFGLAAIAVVLAGVAGILTTNGTEAAGPDRVVAGVGIVPGQGLVVHVVVLVSPGQTDQAAVHAALAAQGARPITSAEYSLTGLVHDGPADGAANGNETVSVVYSGSNMPDLGALTMLQLVEQSFGPWNLVSPSALVFDESGVGAACTSLLRECPGRQVLNGENEVAFWALKSKTTLAVTWSHSGADEFDIAWNTNFDWVDNEFDATGNGVFDVVTVGIHEFGHGAGIGHSDVGGAVMEAVYDGGRRGLHGDDMDALNALYGGGATADPTPAPTETPAPTPTPEPGVADTLTLGNLGGPYGHRDLVIIPVSATDSGTGVEGVAVQVQIVTQSGKVLSGSSTTGADGSVQFSYKVNAGRDGVGTYSVTATAGGLSDSSTFEVE